ncbi:hypothetical protein M409DRAFT_24885 [Zasmidium cellare ATCC 36951]|uniref:Uncharacterized protein n=1 Tax=Zasmidium cellare ATCC 36951 TaxID=1080233 RepID=A0A6A6CCS4_ZASCE|nr:uncharacterized protein M409DRAFT_24885 [Zasmidium cellare ATCC 36951]KAF2164984.1 hypothetical protein M409DRAFT_24885 [Zasmidium cellare ATCC 36951]
MSNNNSNKNSNNNDNANGKITNPLYLPPSDRPVIDPQLEETVPSAGQRPQYPAVEPPSLPGTAYQLGGEHGRLPGAQQPDSQLNTSQRSAANQHDRFASVQQQDAQAVASYRSPYQPLGVGEGGGFAGGSQIAGSGDSRRGGERVEGAEDGGAQGSDVQRAEPEVEKRQPERENLNAAQQSLHLATTTYAQEPEDPLNTAGEMMDQMEREKEKESDGKGGDVPVALADAAGKRMDLGRCRYLRCRMKDGVHEVWCIGAWKREGEKDGQNEQNEEGQGNE